MKNKNTTTPQTPLPWQFGYGKDLLPRIYEPNGDVVCQFGEGIDEDQTTCPNYNANAAFIVCACNAHEELVEALAFAMRYHAMQEEKQTGKDFPPQLINTIRAALAKAKGDA